HCFEERKRRLGEKSRLLPFTGTILPNTSYNGRQPRALCVWHPHGPHHTEVWRFYMVDADAPPEVKDMLRLYYMRYSGPAGMTEQDDMENWNYATAASRGTIARRYPYNYQQSMNAWSEGGELPGRVSTQITEQNARNYYRQWARFLRGASWEELLVSGDPETPQSASAH
ncbi:MAG: aromatic ring-hydroxylating dioxygenase subunit alpha, partial [SAR324 cluster bacterium]|nr:aromatic ring-hydroxylating dioxygenase subunit alpha [SAR324 cluster bacterium]